MLTLADDYGRYDGRASVLWAEAFAVWNEQNPEATIDPNRTEVLCQQLVHAELIGFYEVNNRRYLQIIQWEERARCRSHWPEPPQHFDNNLPQSDSKMLHPSLIVNRSSPSPSPSSNSSKRSTLVNAQKANVAGSIKPRAERMFLADVGAMMDDWSKGSSKTELTNSGGWWRMAFRADRGLMRSVLIETHRAVKERQIKQTPGQYAVDYWKRLGGKMP